MNNIAYITGIIGKKPKLIKRKGFIKAMVSVVVCSKNNNAAFWFNDIEFWDTAAKLVSNLDRGSKITFRATVKRQVWSRFQGRHSKLVLSVNPGQVEIVDSTEILQIPASKPSSNLPVNAAPIIPENNFDLVNSINF